MGCHHIGYEAGSVGKFCPAADRGLFLAFPLAVKGSSETYTSNGAFNTKIKAKESAASALVRAWGL